ncbi:hypothetical protein [Niabella hibiscisoli]|uniref:hypothetical protein n=1 Tax=Niabella hibiscisoli TaxID=1825928 RepID=UPI001F0D67D0|nr:hypothetical protein [Niabella hibiscisoli]MCH5718565.1 hypothetical protein [Niabella hibiscisoli]
MKKNRYKMLLIVLMAGVVSQPLKATACTRDTLPPTIFRKVVKDAIFTGGIDAWKQFLVTHVRGNVAMKKALPPDGMKFL